MKNNLSILNDICIMICSLGLLIVMFWYYPGIVRESTILLMKYFPSNNHTIDNMLFPYWSNHIHELPDTLRELTNLNTLIKGE